MNLAELSAQGRCDAQAFSETCAGIVGKANVLTDPSVLSVYGTDWTGQYAAHPIAVARPGTTLEVAALLRACADAGIAIVPQGGRTGLCGGGVPLAEQGGLILSMERMNRVRTVDEAARTMTVEAGVILENAQEAATQHRLVFPLTFGAKGSCMIGGALSTNAGGMNVLRYGTARELCVGIEAVLPDGSVVNALTGLRKDNTGYDIKDLLIGAEGTLGIITAAVFKLHPQPKARTTAFLSVSSLADAHIILNRLQDRTGGAVEVFEFMPKPAVDVICRTFPNIRQPLSCPAHTGLLIEAATSRADDAEVLPDGSLRLNGQVLDLLAELMEDGVVLDAMVAQSDQQRADLWRMRESILEAIAANGPAYHTDISLPLARVAEFVTTMDALSAELGFQPLTVGHLGDGNLHYALTAAEGRTWDELPLETMRQKLFDQLMALGGSFSAEHGIGQSKLDVMRALKEPAQLAAMRSIKRALDPKNVMNPGKLLPAEQD